MNLNYHIGETSIKCPYCDKTMDDPDYEVAENMDNPVGLECEHCGKNCHAEAKISYDTHSDCALNDIKHDWHNSKTHPTVFHCTNCSQYKVEAPKGGSNE